MIDLTGRIVLITGAAGGIGSATARTLAAALAPGWSIHDVAGPRLTALAEELGDGAHALSADLRDRSKTAGAVARRVRRFTAGSTSS